MTGRLGAGSGVGLTALALAGLVLTACGSPAATPATPATTATMTAPNSPTRAAAAATPSAPTVWLCRPGLRDDPCDASLDATVVGLKGTGTDQAPTDATRPPIDCFYVYPTVSGQPTANADLHVDSAESGVAVDQASRFSQVCNVYAPMYPQLTLAAINGKTPVTEANVAIAYDGVLAAWKAYLASYNHGRGVVFIGHSQGSAMLIKLLQTQVDVVPSVRARLVSAILLGGNPVVPAGKLVGGTFQHIPACTDVTRPGCLIAYSSFDQTPPADALFGRPRSAVDALSGQRPGPGSQVVCVNPALAPDAGSATAAVPATVVPYFFSPGGTVTNASGAVTVSSPWVTYPDRYTATCTSRGGATWLQVDALGGAADPRPVVTPVLGPAWGLHLVDVNLALGNLVTDVGAEAAAYTRAHQG